MAVWLNLNPYQYGASISDLATSIRCTLFGSRRNRNGFRRLLFFLPIWPIGPASGGRGRDKSRPYSDARAGGDLLYRSPAVQNRGLRQEVYYTISGVKR